MRWLGTKEIKYHIAQLIRSETQRLKGKRVLDIPSGNGVSLQLLLDAGAKAFGADLFPELNRTKNAPVVFANMGQALPFQDGSFDVVLCQEGIEHIGNQDHVFTEFSRVLRAGGRLILTTPNYSSLKSRMSYLLTESEAFGRLAPPNEIDSIWLCEKPVDRIYFGHVFLTGILRLRLFGLVAGLKISKVHDSRINYTSLILFPFLYPFICFFSWKTMRRFRRKNGQNLAAREIFNWMISPQILLNHHLIVEFTKTQSSAQAIHVLANSLANRGTKSTLTT